MASLASAPQKRHVCGDCGAAFVRASGLISHRRTHTGERPYQCEDCGAAFAESGALISHQRTHTGERPYQCEECGAAFTTAGSLIIHRRTHTGERPYQCEECGAAFVAAGGLTKHKQAIHSPEGAQRQKRAEHRVARLLEAAGIAFKREHHVDLACVDPGATFARVDFVLQEHGIVVFLEVDEGQHRCGSYSVACDMKRMARIAESMAVGGNTMPLAFVRYNPDSCYVDGELRRKVKRAREAVLRDLLADARADIYRGARGTLCIKYLYYDCSKRGDGSLALDIHDDPAYDATMKACCLAPVV
jgi:DNA-directed RNA polymerase subunit RPC12/RpoP